MTRIEQAAKTLAAAGLNIPTITVSEADKEGYPSALTITLNSEGMIALFAALITTGTMAMGARRLPVPGMFMLDEHEGMQIGVNLAGSAIHGLIKAHNLDKAIMQEFGLSEMEALHLIIQAFMHGIIGNLVIGMQGEFGKRLEEHLDKGHADGKVTDLNSATEYLKQAGVIDGNA